MSQMNQPDVLEPITTPAKPKHAPKPAEKPRIPEKPLPNPFEPIGPQPWSLPAPKA